MATKGWDLFTPDPGVEKSMRCGVCNAKMDVKRDVTGPRSFAAAIGGIVVKHDEFTCPHTDEKWHQQALSLRQKAKDTPSSELMVILEGEARLVIKTKKPTKKSWASHR